MKKTSFIISALSVLLLCNCTKNEIDAPVTGLKTLKAVIEADGTTKSDATDDGKFTWAEGDKITVFTSGGNREGTLSAGHGTNSGTFQYELAENETEAGYAVYPAHSDHALADGEITVTLPASYELGESLRNTNAIMLASKGEGDSYRFTHLAGVMRFSFENVPAGVDKFELSLGGAKINGAFAVADGKVSSTTTDNVAEQTTTLVFDALAAASNITLFVPVPVGTYAGATLKLYAEDEVVWSLESEKTNKVERRSLVKMPAVVVASASGEIMNYVGDATSLMAAVMTGGSVTLAKDIELATGELLTIQSGKEVTLDLNGKTLSCTSAVAGDAMITNNGTLTIKDSGVDGKITYSYTGTPDATYGKGNYTIYNNGVIILEDGVVENTTAAMSHASYAINTGAGATLTINDGKVLNVNGHAVRMVNFGSGANKMTVNGGYIEGTRAIQMQLPGSDPSSAPEMSLDIAGGELKSNEETYNLGVYVYSNGQSGENVSINVTDGTINGNIALNGTVTTGMKEGAVSISGGVINGEYGVFSYEETTGGVGKISITGGVFKSNYYECHAAPGYVFEENTDGAWVVVKAWEMTDESTYVIYTAKGMQWFANEVNDNNISFSGKTVKLAADIDLENAAWTPVGQTYGTQFSGTFDGQGKTISNLNVDATVDERAHFSSGLFGWLNAAIVKNVKVEGATVKGNHNVGVIAGYLETSGCTVENCHVSKAEVECHVVNDDANGDKCGAVVGHAGNAGVAVKNCTATECTVSAGRDAGQIVGAALEVNVTGCSATDVTVTANGEGTGANIRNEVIGRILS